MKYILTAGWEDGIADLTERLVHELAAGKKVLWLTSGGSNIQASVQVMDNISASHSRNLSIMLADERYGPINHPDSNWAQLEAANFKTKHANLLPVLQKGIDFKQTLAHYNQLASEAFANHDLVVAQLGIGADGHILGILPDSQAALETKALIAAYEAPPYMRLTMTFPALQHVDAAYVFAFGTAKLAALKSLKNRSLDPVKQPAQSLKQLKEVYIYNDRVGKHA